MHRRGAEDAGKDQVAVLRIDEVRDDLVRLLRWWWSFVCFLLWPGRFVEHATTDDIKREFETNEQWREAFPTHQLPEDRVVEWRRNRADKTRRLRHSIFGSLAAVIALALAAWGTSLLIGIPPQAIRILRLASAGLIVWAVLGRLGWEIQTWKAVTLVEQVNRTSFRLAYGLGVYLLMLSLLLPTKPS